MMKRLLIVTAMFALALSKPSWAQMTDVPSFDRNGDFVTALVQGNRGAYQHKQWLVIDTDVNGLNCRNINGFVIVKLAYGSVIDSEFEPDGDAIEIVNGRPWLKVSASSFDVQHRVVNRVSETYTCYVRANTNYIAPINPDAQDNQL